MGALNVSSIFYNEAENILTVQYNSGKRVEYQPVNPENYVEVLIGNCLSQAVHKVTRQTQIVGTVQQRGH